MVCNLATTLDLLYFALTLEHLGGVSDLTQMCGTVGLRAAGGGHVEHASTGLDHLSRHAGLCLKRNERGRE